MDRIFAPWRIEWVERDDEEGVDGCPFCVLPERENDRENRVVARSEHSLVLLNNYPYNPGHAMVIPKRHATEYPDLTDDELLDHGRLKQRTLRALDEAMGPDGFNTGLNLGGAAAGGSVDHLHTHVVPRWTGDTSFMPVVGDTKVIVEELERTYSHLHDAFADLDGATVPEDEQAAVRFD
ncbi:HIT family protein [Halobium salinum]|uniref:HIT family protein n=1 Tax=Halobium salinum TaxID=1364940 RepID=A0ABD5P918_9EURY|nr:HIT domain-containing protein [Halobium salinum]